MPLELRPRDWGEDIGRLATHRTQRLLAKPKNDFLAKVSQAFGGGALQLKEDAWKLLQQVFDIDYMGAAEYEFGALPKTLSFILEHVDDYEPFSFVIKSADIEPGWWRQRGIDALRRAEIREAKEKKEKPPRLNKKRLMAKMEATPLKDRTIFVFAPKGEKNQKLVEQLIRDVARKRFNIKAGSHMDASLDPDPGSSYDGKTKGWIDLDNNLFWFLDEEMWKGTLKIFGKESSCPNDESTQESPSSSSTSSTES